MKDVSPEAIIAVACERDLSSGLSDTFPMPILGITIARVNNPKNAWLFTPEMGVDVKLNQADILAHLVAEEMSLGDMMTLLKLRKGEYSIVEEKVHPNAVVVNQTLREIELPPSCVFVAVIRKGQLIVPSGGTDLQPVDELIALVHASQAGALAKLLGPLPSNT